MEYQNIFKVFVTLFEKYPGNEDIIVRLAYTLGNILAKMDTSRIKVKRYLYFAAFTLYLFAVLSRKEFY